MKCKLCESFFVKEINFKNLFAFYDICDACKTTFHPRLHFEAIPISYGLIRYYYLYDDEMMINQMQKDYLKRHMDMLYKEAIHGDYNLLLFIDIYNKQVVLDEIEYIAGFYKIAFLSLVRINFDECVFFY